MEMLSLSEKAECYASKFVPVVRIKNNEVMELPKRNKSEEHVKIYVRASKIKIFPSLFVAIMILFMGFFGLKILTEKNNIFGDELLNITRQLFVPKDFGKIKYVGQEFFSNEEEAYSSMMGLSLPFSVCLATKINDDFLITSAGEILVKCAMDGVVESVKTDEKTFKKTVVISHKYDIKTTYTMLNNVSVKVGDIVTKNTPVGITENNQIGFKITYKNTIVKGLEIANGELTFS